MGKSESALRLMPDDIAWNIVGDRTIDGITDVKAMCEDAAAQGTPNFQNVRVIRAKSHVIVEGADLDSDMHYCDIYAIDQSEIVEITSYCLTGLE